MSTVGLSASSYLILGLIDLAGPATSYDLKRRVGTSIGYFWSFPHSQLYAEPARLAEAGLLEVEAEGAGRRRRVYSLTDAGGAALRSWLADATPVRGEIRDGGLLKLFFGAAAGPDAVRSLAADQIAAYRRGLEELEAIESRVPPGDPGTVHPLLTLEFGKRWARLNIEFWTEVSQR